MQKINVHEVITKQIIRKEYNRLKEKGSWQESKEKVQEYAGGGWITLVDALSDEKYKVYATSGNVWKEEVEYFVWETTEQEGVYIRYKDIEPKSIRERLHNIQENKKENERLKKEKVST